MSIHYNPAPAVTTSVAFPAGVSGAVLRRSGSVRAVILNGNPKTLMDPPEKFLAEIEGD